MKKSLKNRIKSGSDETRTRDPLLVREVSYQLDHGTNKQYYDFTSIYTFR